MVSDGSTDKTIDTALDFARNMGGNVGSCIRFIQLQGNRGKGGAVTHGMRHVRGQYAIFADADGASRFSDLRKLVEASKKIPGCVGDLDLEWTLYGSDISRWTPLPAFKRTFWPGERP